MPNRTCLQKDFVRLTWVAIYSWARLIIVKRIYAKTKNDNF